MSVPDPDRPFAAAAPEAEAAEAPAPADAASGTDPVELAELAEQADQLRALLAPMEGGDPAARRDAWTRIGKELARLRGAELTAALIRDSGCRLTEISARTGFDTATLSRMAHGSHEGGPTLWKLMALAEALGYRLDLTLRRKG